MGDFFKNLNLFYILKTKQIINVNLKSWEHIEKCSYVNTHMQHNNNLDLAERILFRCSSIKYRYMILKKMKFIFSS